MRLPADGDATIAAAVEAGVTVFDTARAYGDNERLVARALRRCGAERDARVVTKGGMTRPAGGWVPDGRAKAILADCEASLAALDGLEIDLYLIHALIRGRRGAPRSARSPGSSTRGSCGGSACRT